MQAIEELMSPNPVVVTPETTIIDCAQRIIRHRIRHLPVVDENGRLLGAVPDYAVFNRGGLVGADLEMWVSFDSAHDDLVASELAEEVDVVAHEGDDAVGVFRRLLRTQQEEVMVLDDEERLIGVVTEHDGVRLAQGLLDEQLLALHEGERKVIAVDVCETAKDAYEMMTQNRIRHIVVTRDGAVAGVLSWRDLIEEDVQNGRDMRADEVMRSGRGVFTVAPRSPLREAAAIMTRERIGCLPIVDAENHPIGVLTRTDLIASAISSLEQEEEFGD